MHSELNKITEFNDVEYVSFESLEKFYIRIKEAPKRYIKDLASKNLQGAL